MDRNDIVSDVVALLRIRSDVYFRARLGPEVSVRVPEEKRRIRFHLVMGGACTVSACGAAVELCEGDLVLIPRGACQVIATGEGGDVRPLESLIAAGALREGLLSDGSPSPQAVLLCGYAELDEAISHPALDILPPALPLRLGDLGGEPWMAAALKLMAFEAGLAGAGMAAILARIVEIIVIQAIRRQLLTGESDEGFIAALADPQLARALKALHGTPQKPWRAAELAAVAGMSRAAFIQRFGAVVGMPPIEYLVRWRLIRARRLLSETTMAIDEVAERCGYRSLPSFSRRFKSAFGIGPGAYRRGAAT